MPTSSYISGAFDPKGLKHIISKACLALRAQDRLTPFDAIAVRGTSGLLVGPSLSWLLGKQLIVVRKPKGGPITVGEVSHACQLVETSYKEEATASYIIVDDCVATGNTVKTMVNEIRTVHPTLTPLKRAYLWSSSVGMSDISHYLKQGTP